MWRNILKTAIALYIPLLIFSLYWGYVQKQSLIQSMGIIQQRNILNKSYHLIDQSINLISITSFWSDINFPEAFSKTNPLMLPSSTTTSELCRVTPFMTNCGLSTYMGTRCYGLKGQPETAWPLKNCKTKSIGIILKRTSLGERPSLCEPH